MSDVTPPQAGWYADPENPAGERWWNGSGWSDHKRDASASVESGLTFGSPAPAVPRADPYTPPPVMAPPTPAPPALAPPYYAAAPGSPYVPYTPYGAPAPRSSNGLAVAGLVVSAAGWILLGGLAAIAGIVLSGFGLARARQMEAAGNPNSGRGTAMAGLVIGIVVFLLSILVVVAYFAFVLAVGYPS